MLSYKFFYIHFIIFIIIYFIILKCKLYRNINENKKISITACKKKTHLMLYFKNKIFYLV